VSDAAETENEPSVDCTHTEASATKKVPERIMKNIEKEKGAIPDGIDKEIPNYNGIEDHKQAKEIMKNYLEKIKSKTDSFYGYKVEFAMVPEERIITSINVHDGAYVDGNDYEGLCTKAKECGINIKEAYGDKAYFRKPILDILNNDQMEATIPVSETVYRVEESMYKYNKDSDQWFCEYGNYTVGKKKKTRKDGRQLLEYKFEKEACKNCPNRKECSSGTGIANKLVLGLNALEFYECSQRAKTTEFLEKYKKRASQEWKNGEMKRFHGMDRARGYGLRSMRTQAKLTALAVNLKRIASLLSSYFDLICYRLLASP
jgi:hypothetical protein